MEKAPGWIRRPAGDAKPLELRHLPAAEKSGHDFEGGRLTHSSRAWVGTNAAATRTMCVHRGLWPQAMIDDALAAPGYRDGFEMLEGDAWTFDDMPLLRDKSDTDEAALWKNLPDTAADTAG